MRPVRLELEGFTAFRDRAVVDFDGVDLFALTGPTGAGKTSVIDAITFALYGSVPRLDERSVAPLISQNGLEARVRLDFTIGEAAFVAVRVVRPTKSGGATTKEARLQSAGGEVLAGDARSMTGVVESLVGLDFKQFTTCVSLPQGEFARFLHAEPRHRQDLLVRLLDLELYGTVGQAARERSKLDDDRAAIFEGQLSSLAFATDEALGAAERRVADLTALRGRLDAMQPELDRLRDAATSAASEAESAAAAAALLDGLEVPPGTHALADEVAAATDARAAAASRESEAASAVAAADAALAALPRRSELEAAQREHTEAVRLRELVAKGEPAVKRALELVVAADAEVARARAAHAAAEATLGTARTDHLAHTLAAEVVVGEPCPVCRRPISEPPQPMPADVAAADERRRAAAAALEAALEAAANAQQEQVRIESKLAVIRGDLASVEARVTTIRSESAVTTSLTAVAEAEATLHAARVAAAEASKVRVMADDRRDRAVAAVENGRRAFDATRDGVAALGPPVPGRDDLAADWQALVAWAGERRPALHADAARHREAADAASRALADKVSAITADCDAAGISPGDRPRDAVVDALANAGAERVRIAEALAESARLRAEAGEAVARSHVARALANHLRSDGFERWLLDEAQRELVAGATELLRDLSGGAYSLALDHKSRAFAVIDHVNADSVRPARTLSGGETFLASLALALALADQVAASAGGGAARLETILLDEGFGTLDADTLDVVAAALEELGARGRMVGVVTHVRELADRLPVRFELRKVGGAATIERVDG